MMPCGWTGLGTCSPTSVFTQLKPPGSVFNICLGMAHDYPEWMVKSEIIRAKKHQPLVDFYPHLGRPGAFWLIVKPKSQCIP
jgi:hypothetical protein